MRTMDFKTALIIALYLMLSYCTKEAVASHSKSCLIRGYSDEKEQDQNPVILNDVKEDANQVADPHYIGLHRRYTLRIQVLHSCGSRLCNSYSARVFVYSRWSKKVCYHGRRRSARYITIRCHLTVRPVTVSVYWPSYRKWLVIRNYRTGYILRAILPRSKRQMIPYSSLQFCPFVSKTPLSHTIIITDQNQGTTCPTGRKRFPVGSVQDLKTRTLDGRLNNKKKIFQGAAGENLIRLAGNGFVDKISVPSGACSVTQTNQSQCPFPKENNGTGSNRPNARVISNFLIAQNRPIPSRRGLSDLITYFGQFLDHDTDLAEPLPRTEVQVEPNDLDLPIPVPKGDLIFDIDSKGNKVIPVRRFEFDKCTGNNTCRCPRMIINTISSVLDANTIYGSNTKRSRTLRTLKNGLLKTDKGNLPLNTFGLPNANDIRRDPTKLRIAGDNRANVAPTLLSLHTLFLREHNRLAKRYKRRNPTATDEKIFQYTRKMVIAEIQAITFREYIPSLLGGTSRIPKYKGYNPKIDTSIATEFSNAAFRFGHTQISSIVHRYEKNGAISRFGNLLLRDGFFRPDRVTNEGGINPILRGAIKHRSQEIDTKIVDELRNFLFQAGGVSLDLAAINIQRGREAGIPDYNTVRKKLGLKKRTSFFQITKNRRIATKLKNLYKSINNVDLWVGGIAEDHEPRSALGETFRKIFLSQFIRIRDGDRFWYKRILTRPQITYIHRQTLSRIIRLNTGIKAQRDVFFASESCKSVQKFKCIGR